MIRIVLTLAATAVTLPAMAQTAPTPTPAPAPAQQGLGGPVIPGVCLLSREAVFANSKIGVAGTARLKQLADAAQAEVEAQRKPIDADIQAFQTEAPKLAEAARNQRQQALAARLQPVQTLAAQRSREIEATRAKALQRISTEAQPIIAQVYAAHKCGLVLDRGSVLGGNFANDLTADVVKALDAKIATITFERETLPPAPVAAAPRQ